MKQDTYTTLVEKSRTKKNGVYTLRGNFYLVKDKQLAGYCDYFGNVYQCVFGFIVSMGKAKDRFEGRDALKNMLKQL